MIHLADDRLVDLALGVGAPATTADTAHTHACATCQAMLESLSATVEATRGTRGTVLVDPPARVWQAIRAEIALDAGARPSAAHDGTSAGQAVPSQAVPSPAVDSPDITPVAPISLDQRRSHRAARTGAPLSWLLAAACVLGIVLGVGGAGLADRFRSDPAPAETTLASASLAPLDSEQVQAVANVVERDSGLNLILPAMDLDAGDGYLEVWLINRDLTRMISVGVIPTDAPETIIPVSQDLLDQGYVIVDISRELFDDQPAHSGNTLVRGELSA